MAVEAKLNTETLKPEKAGEHCFPACNHVLGFKILLLQCWRCMFTSFYLRSQTPTLTLNL